MHMQTLSDYTDIDSQTQKHTETDIDTYTDISQLEGLNCISPLGDNVSMQTGNITKTNLQNSILAAYLIML